MAKAIKCDRCGKFASMEKNSPKIEAPIGFYNWISLMKGSDLGMDKEPLHLCPDCVKDFERFIIGASIKDISVER